MGALTEAFLVNFHIDGSFIVSKDQTIAAPPAKLESETSTAPPLLKLSLSLVTRTAGPMIESEIYSNSYEKDFIDKAR